MENGIYCYMCRNSSSAYTLTFADSANLNFSTALVSLIAALLGLIIVIVGVVCIKELRMRGFDSVCGFHARLKANLLMMRKSVGITERQRNDKAKKTQKEIACEASQSVFMWFADAATIAFISEHVEADDMFKEKDIQFFMSHVISSIRLFNQSTGQIPLSQQMHSDLAELFATLLDIVEAHRTKSTLVLNSMREGIDKEGLFTAEKILVKANQFNEITLRIINEIDRLTKKLLWGLWNEFKEQG